MKELIQKIREFNSKRMWSKFHTPKNLSMALSVEVSEIVELFQWLTEEESKNLDSEKAAQLKEEIGDVMIFLTNLADKFNINPIEAANVKIEINERKYPAEIVKGKAKKYSEY